MNVAVRVQHHESRAALLPALLERLAGFEDVQVITDPGGPKPSSWRTYRLCLESISDDATHLLIVQDDAYPCDRFHVKTLDVIETHPGRIIVAFTPGFGFLTRPMQQARQRGASTMELRVTGFCPTVATCYPREHALAIPAYADAKRIHVGRADDAVVAAYVKSHRCGALATVPSLVQHLDVPSAMGMKPKPGAAHRVAALFADA